MTDQTLPPEIPPTEPDFDDSLLADPPAWPKAVGITSIVWSSLGLACGGCGLGMGAFAGQLMKLAEQEMGGPAPAVMLPSKTVLVVGAVSMVWTGLLLAAGIATVARKPVGRTLHLIYAPGAIVLTLVGTFLNYQSQAAVTAWAAQNPADRWAQSHNPTMGVIMLGVGMFLGLTWAIFCLVWFGLVKRTHESMTGGIDEPAA